jgi:hypothetical protein
VVFTTNRREPAPCLRQVALLRGDTSQQLVSPFVLVRQVGEDPVPVAALGMVNLVPPPPNDGGGAAVGGEVSLLALGSVDEGGAAPVSEVQPVAVALGSTLLAPAPSPRTVLDGVSAADLQRLVTAVGDVDGDGVIDAVFAAGVRFGFVPGSGAAPLVVDLLEALGVGGTDRPSRVRALWLVDLDADGDRDVVGLAVDLDAARASPTSAAVLWAGTNLGGAPLPEVAWARLDGADGVTDAAPVRAFADGRPAAVMTTVTAGEAATTYAVILRDLSPGPAVDGVTLLSREEPITGVEVADFTGDGLDDVAVLGERSVVLLRQCSDELGVGGCGGAIIAEPGSP